MTAPRQCWHGKRESRRLTQAHVDRIRRLFELHGNGTVAAAIVGVSLNTITRLKRNGWKAYDQVHRYRPMPDDFPLTCQKLSFHEMRAHYGAGQRVIYRWLAQTTRDYEPRRCGPACKPMPSKTELERVIAERGAIGAARFYGVHRNTMTKWRDLLGIPIAERYVRRRKLQQRAAEQNWVERYVAERRAA